MSAKPHRRPPRRPFLRLRKFDAPDWKSRAAGLIRKADRSHPADRLLRDLFRGKEEISSEDREQISQAVFAYYRWRGWLNLKSELREQIDSALELADSFRQSPESVSDADLMAKGVPEWLGEVIDVTPAWVRSLQAPPPLWIRVRSGYEAPVEEELGRSELQSSPLKDCFRYTGKTDLFQTRAFKNGWIELQDFSSQAVGFLCAARPGETWWDACAGEGGKLLHLSDLMKNQGLIWASDRSTRRLQSLKRRTARAKVFNYRAVEWEGKNRPPFKTKLDGILIDAPCSGIGTWHRNPQARWTTTRKDVSELAAIQWELIRASLPGLKPGGRLIYSVCTLASEETVGIFERVAAELKQLEPLALSNPLDHSMAPVHAFRLEECGGNGMFVAGWRLVT